MLMAQTDHANLRQKSLRTSGFFHFIMHLLLGIILPPILFFEGQIAVVANNNSVFNSVVATAFAAVAGMTMLRRLSVFPGVSQSIYVVPCYAFCFGLVAAIILLLRLDYSAAVLLLNFGATLAIAFVLSAASSLQKPHRMFIVPGGRVASLNNLENAELQYLQEPVIPLHSNGPSRNGVLVADLHHDHDPEWEKLLAKTALAGMPVYHFKQVWEARSGQVRIEHLSENSFGSLIPNLNYHGLKRIGDVVLSLVVTPFLVIPMAIVAIAIKLDTPGPVFYFQERIGYQGHKFKMIKFRSMRVHGSTDDPETRRNDKMTKSNDERISKLGNILRQYRIDELPQILNILRGEMSWIGPRPEAIELGQWYENEIPFYGYRHIVRPGITGWAQVNQGHVTDLTSINDKLRYDFFYIKNFSYWLDMLIALKTVMVILRGFGAR